MRCQIWRSTSGQFFVRVVASNGAILAHSETYVAKVDARTCANIIANGGTVEDNA